MNKWLVSSGMILLLLAFTACQTDNSVATTKATPIPQKTVTVQFKIVNQSYIGSLNIYIYKGQQLSMSFNCDHTEEVKVALPNNTTLTYYHTPDSPIVGRLDSSNNVSATSGSFVYESKLDGFYIFTFTIPTDPGSFTRLPATTTVTYETR